MANVRPILRPGEPLEKWLAQFMPHVSIDCVVFGFHGADLKLLLLKWKGVDTWTLPGGFVGRRQSVDDAAHQVLQARTGLRRVHLRQFHAFGDLGRKEATGRRLFSRNLLGVPRRNLWLFQRVISVGYYALVDIQNVRPTTDAWTESCAWYPVDSHPPVAYDHDRIVEGAREALRAAVDVPGAGASLMPERFTMPELQCLHEAILGRRLDRRNFQKRMLERGGIERLQERRTGGAHRAPYLYRFTVSHAGLDF
jgi:8-oxo-dGTP diphosphatase